MHSARGNIISEVRNRFLAWCFDTSHWHGEIEHKLQVLLGVWGGGGCVDATGVPNIIGIKPRI